MRSFMAASGIRALVGGFPYLISMADAISAPVGVSSDSRIDRPARVDGKVVVKSETYAAPTYCRVLRHEFSASDT